jgi:tripartite-type tricarboxylate transporter receptor subunit TctC
MYRYARNRFLQVSAFGLLSALSGFAAPACAQTVADFYKGRQVTIVVASSAGGGYDLQGRLFARHMGEHLPGKPTMIVQNMPGAGGLTAANHIYTIAPKDGSLIGVVQRGVLTAKLTSPGGVRFDLEKFGWIGNLAPEVAAVVAWPTSPVQTTQDLFTKEFIVGGNGPTLDPETVPRMLNALIGTKFKIVSGYTATPDVLIAMQRGELHGLADFAWGNVKRRPDLQLKVLMQSGLAKSPDLPDVPLALDFVKNEDDRKVMELFFVQKTVARPLVAPPGLPADRLAALRDGFIAMTKDKTFLEETGKLSIDVEPERGEALDALVSRIAATPPDVAARLAKLIAP